MLMLRFSLSLPLMGRAAQLGGAAA